MWQNDPCGSFCPAAQQLCRHYCTRWQPGRYWFFFMLCCVVLCWLVFSAGGLSRNCSNGPHIPRTRSTGGIKSGLFIWKASASPEPVFPLKLILHCSHTGFIKDENLSCGQQAEGKKNSEYNSERVLDTHDTQSEWTVGDRPVYLKVWVWALYCWPNNSLYEMCAQRREFYFIPLYLIVFVIVF